MTSVFEVAAQLTRYGVPVEAQAELLDLCEMDDRLELCFVRVGPPSVGDTLKLPGGRVRVQHVVAGLVGWACVTSPLRGGTGRSDANFKKERRPR